MSSEFKKGELVRVIMPSKADFKEDHVYGINRATWLGLVNRLEHHILNEDENKSTGINNASVSIKGWYIPIKYVRRVHPIGDLTSMREIAKLNKLSDFKEGQKVTVVASHSAHTSKETTVTSVTSCGILTANCDSWAFPRSLYIHDYIHKNKRDEHKPKEQDMITVKQGNLSDKYHYRVNRGQLGGYMLKPVKVSKCCNFAFFPKPGRNICPGALDPQYPVPRSLPGTLIRIHEKDLTLSINNAEMSLEAKRVYAQKYKIKPEALVAKVKENDKDSMTKLRAIASTYVGTENIKRIEFVKRDLLGRTEANIAEIDAIKAGIAQPKTRNWREFGYGMAVAGAGFAAALGIAQIIY